MQKPSYNHDGYSAAVAREYQRTRAVTRFKVLGTDMEVGNSRELADKLKDKWTMPEPKTIEQVEAEFKTQLDKIRQSRPKAVGAVLRDGAKGWDPADPGKVYAGWKIVYLSCHGPDGPNEGREKTRPLHDTVEAFMRHRSVLMQVDLSSIPKDATILAARLVVTRSLGSDLKPPAKPNLWVAEPCNRDWEAASANCYCYAKGKYWKAVSGLYYGEDPDFWPVFIAHGPAGGGAVTVWDFGEAVKFWFDGRHVNHGFFLYGDSNDYMSMYTPRVKDMVHPAEAYLRRWKVDGGQVPVPPLCSSQPPRSPVRPASNRRFERPEIAEQRRGTGTPSVAQSCVAIVGCARFSRMNQRYQAPSGPDGCL